MRTVRRSHFFEAGARRIQPDARRFDEAIESIEWSIGEDPYIWPEVPGRTFRLALTKPLQGVPSLRIAFTIDDDSTCTLHAVALRNYLD
jgi:hypothetical protein